MLFEDINVLGLLPFFGWAVIYVGIKHMDEDWRAASLKASLIFGVWVVVVTEVLSLFHLITQPVIALTWTAGIAGMAWKVVRTPQARDISPANHEHFSPTYYIYGSITVIMMALIGVVALAAPPNTGDALGYHMSRVMHWIQNETANHYLTSMQHQLYQNPFTEYAILHLQILSGGDHFANLVQFFSMVGSVIGVSLIVRQLGGDRFIQVLAAVFCVTIPVGILEASSAKNDYVLAFWMLCLAYFVMIEIRSRFTYVNALWIGMSLGLAVLTKGTAYVYALPFLLWFLGVGFARLRWRIVPVLVVVGGLALLMNLPHYARNVATYDSPFGPTMGQDEDYRNRVWGPGYWMSNAVRNVALHVMLPPNRLDDRLAFRAKAENVVRDFHTFIGISVDDPRTTFLNSQFEMHSWNTEETQAGNPGHLGLIVVAGVIFLWQFRLWQKHHLAGYAACLAGQFFLYNLLLTWQPWATRLHLPGFVMASPFVALMLAQLRPRFMVHLAVAALIVLGSGPLFINASRPLYSPRSVLNTDRVTQYFRLRRHAADMFADMADTIYARECRSIGLDLRGGGWEYGIWAIWAERTDNASVRMERIGFVDPYGLEYPLGEFEPCAMIVVQLDEWNATEIEIDQVVYEQYQNWPLNQTGLFFPAQGIK